MPGGTFTAWGAGDGRLYAWGHNLYGELGLNNTTEQHVPAQVGTDADWVAISAGAYHTLGQRADGSLYAWGYNAYGQLGWANTGYQTSPAQVGDGATWVAAAAANPIA